MNVEKSLSMLLLLATVIGIGTLFNKGIARNSRQ